MKTEEKYIKENPFITRKWNKLLKYIYNNKTNEQSGLITAREVKPNQSGKAEKKNLYCYRRN